MSRFIPAVVFGLSLGASIAWAGGAIYGTIFTDRNQSFTGPIRWDVNENFWDDVLDTQKRDKVFVERSGARVRIFGLEFGDDDGYWTRSELKIQFGHIAAIEPRRGDRVRIELKSGEKLEVSASGTDLGDGMRRLTITDEREGDTDLDWDDVDRIEFRSGQAEDRDRERLYGTVETHAGEFTGYVVWDRDEALGVDILDGREDGRKRKIPFERIAVIERRGSRGSDVTLKTGETMFLDDSNDVDDDNRGIDIMVAGVGVVRIDWDDFDRVTFADPPPSRRYEDFDGGARLYGTVTDDRGRTYQGRIIWDLDEKYSWEFLDGEDHDVKYMVPFDHIRSIRRESRRSAEVTLTSGQVLHLSDSNDVDRDNKGIVIEMEGGDEMELDWSAFASVEFSRP